MKVIIQRVSHAQVKVNHKIVGSIKQGLVLLVGFTNEDSEETIAKMVDKIVNLRIFNDHSGIMNLSLNQIKGEILSISQFTLYADTTKGRRPSYAKSLDFKNAEQLYLKFNELLKATDLKIETGVFGAQMKVELINDGPVTIILDSVDYFTKTP